MQEKNFPVWKNMLPCESEPCQNPSKGWRFPYEQTGKLVSPNLECLDSRTSNHDKKLELNLLSRPTSSLSIEGKLTKPKRSQGEAHRE